MSNNQETLIKETNELLETAQKEVLREINSRGNIFSRLFTGSRNDNLKQAQSAISKAINQMKNFGKDETVLIGKLQNHLNEKNATVKKYEEDLQSNEKELKELKDRMKFYKEEFEKLQTQIKEKEKTQIESTSQAGSMLINPELDERVKALETQSRENENKFKASQEELEKSQLLSIELSKRIKRLKSELLN